MTVALISDIRHQWRMRKSVQPPYSSPPCLRVSVVQYIMAERAGIEPATDGVIRPLLVLKTSRTTRSILSKYRPFHTFCHIVLQFAACLLHLPYEDEGSEYAYSNFRLAPRQSSCSAKSDCHALCIGPREKGYPSPAISSLFLGFQNLTFCSKKSFGSKSLPCQ
jgi:hypothetical protein